MGRWNARFDEESERLISLLGSVNDEQWDMRSLCGDWRVRDVAGHMTMGASYPLAKVGWLVATRYRGNIHRGSAQESVALGSLPRAELLERFVESRRRPIGVGRALPTRDALADNAIHELDIRLALGLDGPEDVFDAEFAADVLGLVATMWSPLIPISRWNRGLTLRATDIGWERVVEGGPVVEGPAEWLIVALARRRAGLDRVTGGGVAKLAGGQAATSGQGRSRSTVQAASSSHPS